MADREAPTNPEALTANEAALGRIEFKLDKLIHAVSSLAEPVTEIPMLRKKVADLELDVRRLSRDTDPAPPAPPWSPPFDAE